MKENKKQSVLVIENDVTVLDSLSKKFHSLNVPVITADDGYDGYVRACLENPSHIVSGTLLPSMTGFKLTRLLKYDKRYRNIKIVLLSSNNLKIEDEVFQYCGAEAIIKKPFKFSELINKLEFKPES